MEATIPEGQPIRFRQKFNVLGHTIKADMILASRLCNSEKLVYTGKVPATTKKEAEDYTQDFLLQGWAKFFASYKAKEKVEYNDDGSIQVSLKDGRVKLYEVYVNPILGRHIQNSELSDDTDYSVSFKLLKEIGAKTESQKPQMIVVEE